MDDCAMNAKQYSILKAKVIECKEKGFGIKDMLAEIHNLFQEYMISPTQEEELYQIADPDDLYNSPSEYWYDDYGCLPIWQCVQ